MNAQVHELMVSSVISTRPHKSVGHVKEIMQSNGIHAVPVVNEEGVAVGIVSAADFLDSVKDSTPVSHVMTEKIYSVPQYSGVHIAARIMRNHKIHHLLVTDEQKLIGILSSFDLLKLVEEHRFVMKPASKSSKKRASGRK